MDGLGRPHALGFPLTTLICGLDQHRCSSKVRRAGQCRNRSLAVQRARVPAIGCRCPSAYYVSCGAEQEVAPPPSEHFQKRETIRNPPPTATASSKRATAKSGAFSAFTSLVRASYPHKVPATAPRP